MTFNVGDIVKRHKNKSYSCYYWSTARKVCSTLPEDLFEVMAVNPEDNRIKIKRVSDGLFIDPIKGREEFTWNPENFEISKKTRQVNIIHFGKELK